MTSSTTTTTGARTTSSTTSGLDGRDGIEWARFGPDGLAVEMADGPDSVTMRVRLPTHPRSATVARALVSTLLDDRGAPSECRTDVVLAVSEASTNAIEYGVGDHLDVCVELDRDVCIVRVGNRFRSDRSRPGIADSSDSAMPEATAVRGRGVAIMELVMDELSVHVDHDRCTVHMYRRFGEDG
jgi:serine/threonine-protein kinase RsbW